MASKGVFTLNSLNRINGVEARGFFLNGNDIRKAKTDYAEYFESPPFFPNPLKWVISYFKKLYKVYKLIKWADVVHWVWDSAFFLQLDLKIVKLLAKPGIVEWSGSDIRYKEKAIELNPFMQVAYNTGYEYSEIETKEKSLLIQTRFSKLGFFPLTTPEMNLYINKALFERTYITMHRLNVKQFEVRNELNVKPLVVHAPSKRVAKGTDYIVSAIQNLKNELDFDFLLLENMPRAEALLKMSQCDIFIDQLMLGSHGISSCEAMSFGKPVICFIMPAVVNNGLPADCPIVNATIDTITEELKKLLVNRDLRNQIGKKSREYALRVHDEDLIAEKFVKIYSEVIRVKGNKN